jgi:NAD(P)-dependent dehydrogenase (short-subunit alcohol dehydrogenase family)
MGEPRPVAVLTGASGRLGTALCERLRSRYDLVAVWHIHAPDVDTDRRMHFDPLDPAAAGAEGTVFEIRADLTERGQIERVVELALARFGRVDALVNAIGRPIRATLLDDGVEPLSSGFAVNAIAPIAVAIEVARRAWRHDAGGPVPGRSVVNVSAAAALDVADVSLGTAAAAKAALNVLTAHLADELRPYQVRANAVAPASFPDVIPLERVVDAVVGLLEGDESGRLLVLWPDSDELV